MTRRRRPLTPRFSCPGGSRWKLPFPSLPRSCWPGPGCCRCLSTRSAACPLGAVKQLLEHLVLCVRRNCIVPVAMKLVFLHVYCCQFFVRDLDSCLIRV